MTTVYLKMQRSTHYLLVPVWLALAASVAGQKIAEFSVDAGSYERLNSVVSAVIDGLPLELEKFDLELRELAGGHAVPVPSQMEGGLQTRLYWILNGHTLPHTVRTYELWQVPRQNKPDAMEIRDDGASFTVERGDKPVLSYRYGKASLPAGVAEAFSRGGFIHPLWSPSGEKLTRIQPPDHYHHYGIWNPWTHTDYEDREVDFWNLGRKQGTVRVNGKPTRVAGDVFATISTIHQHVVFPDSQQVNEKIALDEKWQMQVWNADPAASTWVVDVISTLTCATESPLTLKEYRYQGFGYRGKAEWNDENTMLLTSEGFNKENANATRARWCDVRGPSVAGKSGILFMTHPANYNFPELLRIWPTGSNKGVENVFINFNPTQDRDWTLEPGRSYTLKYRMLIYDGDISKQKADLIWKDYAHPAKVTTTLPNNLRGKKVLVYTRNGEGYVHNNIASSVAALKKLGAEHGFMVDATDSASIFTSPALMEYDAIVFSNTNNEGFETERQKVAFQRFIRSGKGFVGIHSASGSERNWPWYWKLIGGKFLRHPPIQKFEVEVIDRSHPSTNFLPEIWMREDECYFLQQLNPSNHVLLAARLPNLVDEQKTSYPGNTFGELMPLAWCHEFDGGRQWYTALGHSIEHYQDPEFLKHILGGIEWVCSKD